MTEDDDLDAAERALGTLPPGQETPKQAKAREDWDNRLAPLADFIDPVAPPGDLFARIEDRLDEQPGDVRTIQNTGALIRLAERRAARWRGVAIGAMAASVALAAWIALGPSPEPGPRYIAAMTPDGGQTVVVDIASGIATVWPVPSQAGAQGAFEVWHVPGGGAPVSLGLASAEAAVELSVAAVPGDAIAISLEPPGGSPTGQPTGAVLFSGVLQAKE